MRQNSTTRSLVVIITLLAILFLSQQSYFDEMGKKVKMAVGDNLERGVKWFSKNIYPKVEGEVEQKSAMVKEEVEKQKGNIIKNLWDKMIKYLSDFSTRAFSGQPK